MNRFEVLSHAIKQAGEYCLSAFTKINELNIEEKGIADFVTTVDRNTETMIRDIIKKYFPHDHIIGEDFGGEKDRDKNGVNNFWSIDPLDGTANFLSGSAMWCVSVGWVESDIPVLGGISMPALKTTLIGGKADGETFPLHCTSELFNPLQLKKPTVFAVGRNATWDKQKRYELEEKIEREGLVVVSHGTCAVSLALTALGRLNGYYEYYTNLYDCAAGYALCKSAGVEVKLRLDKKPALEENHMVEKASIVATNNKKIFEWFK